MKIVNAKMDSSATTPSHCLPSFPSCFCRAIPDWIGGQRQGQSQGDLAKQEQWKSALWQGRQWWQGPPWPSRGSRSLDCSWHGVSGPLGGIALPPPACCHTSPQLSRCAVASEDPPDVVFQKERNDPTPGPPGIYRGTACNTHFMNVHWNGKLAMMR